MTTAYYQCWNTIFTSTRFSSVDVTARLSITSGPLADGDSRASTAEHQSHEADSMARAKQSLCDNGALPYLDCTFVALRFAYGAALCTALETDNLLASTRSVARIYSTTYELL